MLLPQLIILIIDFFCNTWGMALQNSWRDGKQSLWKLL
uniref:Uncharacterized protein n=1 Tax=Arundo donax TaxID=35708 RepID=A0A0A9FUM7_ARUDO